ncbi:XRE family transcriptional regulator [bacterium]|nr:XRE family transcriptional regulator [bacterium]
MQNLKKLFSELGISKVRLAKYLGVSRQMLYNYLAEEKLENWPKEKVMKILCLLGIKDVTDLDTIKVDGEYIIQVENRLNEGVKDENTRYYGTEDLKGLNKKEQELLSDIIQLLKEKIVDDKSKEVYHSYRYLYHFLQSMETAKELKYMLAYISKSMGFIDANEYAFNEDRQFVFESIMFSAMTLYNNGSASKSKIAETHKRFVQEIEHKKEEVLGRTQELNTAKVQALRELGYTEINTNNAKEVLDKIAEIQSRKV